MQLQSAFTYGKPAERRAGGCCSGRTLTLAALPRLVGRGLPSYPFFLQCWLYLLHL